MAFSLMIAIVLSYYRTRDVRKKRYIVIASTLLGIIASIVSTVIRNIPNFINRTKLSFLSMIPIVIALIIIIILMIIENKINENKFENILSFGVLIYIVGIYFYYLPNVFNQAHKFAYYGESIISTMVLFRVMGYVFAIIMMILSSVSIYKCASKLKKNQMKTIVFLSLLVTGITQLNVILQRFYFKGIIPKNPILFKIITTIANNENIFMFIDMFVMVLIPIILYKQNVKVTSPYRNNAELRKIKFYMRNKRRWSVFFILIILVNVFSLTFVKSYATKEQELSPPEDYTVEDGMIVIPLETLEDMHLHRYKYKASDGIEMRFFAIKKQESSYGVVLDACEICGPSGYFERGNDVVCKLCDVVMNRGTIGFAGGCNPIPFPYMVHDKKIKINPKDLDSFSYVFK